MLSVIYFPSNRKTCSIFANSSFPFVAAIGYPTCSLNSPWNQMNLCDCVIFKFFWMFVLNVNLWTKFFKILKYWEKRNFGELSVFFIQMLQWNAFFDQTSEKKYFFWLLTKKCIFSTERLVFFFWNKSFNELHMKPEMKIFSSEIKKNIFYIFDRENAFSSQERKCFYFFCFSTFGLQGKFV